MKRKPKGPPWLSVAECVGCGDPAPMGKPCPRCRLRARQAWRIVVLGVPVSQKNDKVIRYRQGTPFISSSDEVKAWRRDAYHQIRNQWRLPPIAPGIAVELVVRAFLAKGQTMDDDNIAGAPMDALEEAGVIANDHQFDPLTVKRDRSWSNPRVEMMIRPANYPPNYKGDQR